VGAAKTAFVTALVAAARLARADPCTGVTEAGDHFATCFDPGNRLSLTAATDGFGGALALRHEIHFEDEPDLVWKMEHVALDTSYDAFADRFSGTVYRAYFLRHARDGHIVIPLGTPKKVFLPFDIGAFIEVGNLRWQSTGDATLGVVKTAALVDISRSTDFKRRFAFGPVASWDMDLSRSPVGIAQHRIAPFSAVMADLRIESDNGLTILDLRGEAGTTWHTTGAWQRQLAGEVLLERVVLAVRDQPIAIYASARYDHAANEAIAAVGLRIVLFDRADPRVSRL